MKTIFINLLALSLVAHAGPRSSANYTVPTETTDSGGGRTAFYFLEEGG